MEDSFIATPDISFLDRSKRGHKREEREKRESRLKRKRKKKKGKEKFCGITIIIII